MALSEKFLIPILQKMIQIPTENPTGETEELVLYLDSLFPTEKGFRKKIIRTLKNGVELHSLVVELGEGKKKIVLCGHLDTVPSGSKDNWKFDPFSGTIENENVFGRGSADMKGGVVSLIGVMYDFLDKSEFLQKYTLVFAGTADEEAGMSGAEALEKDGLMEDAILLIIPEATNMQIGIAEKGVVWVKLKIIGKQAHGSMPEQGINAIESAARIFPRLHSCLSDKSSKILGKSTLNIGTISGGTKINVVPNEVMLELDFRLIPEEDQKSLIEKLSNLEKKPGNIQIEYLQVLPALITSKNDFLFNLIEMTGGKQIGLSYGTDAAKLLKNKDVPFVIFGPGDSTIIHQDNEHVPIKQVIQVAEKLCQALIKTYQ